MPQNLITAVRRPLQLLCCALVLAVLIMAAPARAANGDTVNTVAPPLNSAVCSGPQQQAFNEGREIAVYDQMARDDKFMRFNVSAAYAANCINQFIGYVKKLSDVVTSINTVAGATSVVAAAVTLIATQILEAVVNQIIQAINNQVCNITNEVMGALDSVMQNAICLPRIGGIGNFDFDINPNLGRTQCEGWSINPVGVIGEGGVDPASSGGTAFDAPVVMGQITNGSYGYAGGINTVNQTYASGGLIYSSDLPPTFRVELPDSGGSFDYYDGENLPPSVPSNLPSDQQGNGALCGNGNYTDFADDLAGSECSTGYRCVNAQGYIGRYQMGCMFLKSAGFISNSCPSNGSNPNPNTYNWTSLANSNGINSLATFLNSTAGQDAAVARGHRATWSYVDNDVKAMVGQTIRYGVYRKVQGSCVLVGTQETVLTQSGLLAAAHLLGHAGAERCLRQSRSGSYCSVTDGNCTSGGVYVNRHGGFDIGQISGQSCAAR